MLSTIYLWTGELVFKRNIPPCPTVQPTIESAKRFYEGYYAGIVKSLQPMPNDKGDSDQVIDWGLTMSNYLLNGDTTSYQRELEKFRQECMDDLKQIMKDKKTVYKI